MSLAAADLADLARRAVAGNTANRDALAEIWQCRVLHTLGEGGHPALGEIYKNWNKAVADYDQGWKQVTGKGVPTNLRPDLPIVLPSLLLAVMDETFAQRLRTQATQPQGEAAVACPWHPALKSLDARLPAQALILIQLVPAAEQCGREKIARDEEEIKRKAEKERREATEREQQIQAVRRKWKLRFSLGVAVLSALSIAGLFYWYKQEQAYTELFKTMAFVEGGTFQMGSPTTEKDRNSNERQHAVTVKDFSIGKYEVTQAQWRAVMGSDPPELRFKGCDDCPVESVSWNDIQEFLSKLNARTGKSYRLPTEAEWEYACRSGGKEELYCGGADLDRLAWHEGNSDRKTHPVGQKAPNGLGLYDMSGNVWEWTCSAYVESYDGSESKRNDRAGVARRVDRGGGWFSTPVGVRSATRGRYTPGDRYDDRGLRLAQD